MLIITADDFGKNRHATDNILRCFSENRITSASAMVFMDDSERAASAASASGLEIGLHVNFTLPFTTGDIPSRLREQHNRIVSYLTGYRFSQVVFNPKLRDAFNAVFLSQYEEFVRLYSRPPDFYNGHNHMHLCANMLMGNYLPKGSRIRRTYTFERGEKRAFNRLYRRVMNSCISTRFVTTDTFFSIDPVQNHERTQKIVSRAMYEDVEIAVHPEDDEESDYLLGDKFQALKKTVQTGSFLSLPSK